MIVFSFFVVPRRRNSLNIKHPIWAKVMLAFHILIGLAVSCLGLWLCWWAPSTRSRDNPYWSGLIVSSNRKQFHNFQMFIYFYFSIELKSFY